MNAKKTTWISEGFSSDETKTIINIAKNTAKRNKLVNQTNWHNFLSGESQLECKDQLDAEILLQVCKENNIATDGWKALDNWKEYPYWYVHDGFDFIITRYTCDDDHILSAWTVKDYIEEHRIR